MLLYMGFDDTDDANASMGTGRLVRLFATSLAEEFGQSVSIRGILRHQLPRFDDIPYTSNNSSACMLLETSGDAATARTLMDRAAAHLRTHCAPGSDPGLCVLEADAVQPELVEFAVQATGRVMTQAEAMAVVAADRLAGLGGTNDGIIGAAAAVGLTRYGWCGRFIEYGGLRALNDPRCVGDVMDCGIRVMAVDRDPLVPRREDALASGGWIRPSVMGGEPVLLVVPDGPGRWKTAHTKRKHA